MKLGKYRIVYNAYYNYYAIHDVERHADVWIVEEQCRVTLFRFCKLWDYWSEHKEPDYHGNSVLQFNSPEKAFAYVERLLNGNPRNKIIKTVVTEVNHERIN